MSLRYSRIKTPQTAAYTDTCMHTVGTGSKANLSPVPAAVTKW